MNMGYTVQKLEGVCEKCQSVGGNWVDLAAGMQWGDALRVYYDTVQEGYAARVLTDKGESVMSYIGPSEPESGC